MNLKNNFEISLLEKNVTSEKINELLSKSKKEVNRKYCSLSKEEYIEYEIDSVKYLNLLKEEVKEEVKKEIDTILNYNY